MNADELWEFHRPGGKGDRITELEAERDVERARADAAENAARSHAKETVIVAGRYHLAKDAQEAAEARADQLAEALREAETVITFAAERPNAGGFYGSPWPSSWQRHADEARYMARRYIKARTALAVPQQETP